MYRANAFAVLLISNHLFLFFPVAHLKFLFILDAVPFVVDTYVHVQLFLHH